MFREFREFAMRGNVVDLAVGIIIGAAFGKIVTSLVNDIVMPPVGLLLGINPWIAFAIFLLVRFINRLSRQPEATPEAPTTRECPFCLSSIPLRATRCPQCTSTLQAA